MIDAIERLRRHMYDEDGDIISEREVDEAFAAIDRALKAIHDIYWEATNLGTAHKWLASDDGEIDEHSPSYIVSQVVHEFARKVIKPAAQANGVELFR
ncbi:hypothetical protein SAMN02927924_01392 [Sphingobium faniae]|nr:hypothetical protein SAMN02927924_01392 [Sphingobium faniae]